MSISDWINIVSAAIVGAGTIFLGTMAYRAIVQTRNIERTHRRHQTINEIIDWAISIAEFEMTATSSWEWAVMRKEKPSSVQRYFLYAETDKSLVNLKGMKIRGQHMALIAPDLGSTLNSNVNQLITNFNDYVNLVSQYKNSIKSILKNKSTKLFPIKTEPAFKKLSVETAKAEQLVKENVNVVVKTAEGLRSAANI